MDSNLREMGHILQRCSWSDLIINLGDMKVLMGDNEIQHIIERE